MRISDWSSDVCSSDLGDGAVLDRVGDPAAQPRARAGRYRARRFRRAAERRAAAHAGGRDRLQDRKRVVSGKSVSVRVDLGGRRIIKKKSTTVMQSQHEPQQYICSRTLTLQLIS